VTPATTIRNTLAPNATAKIRAKKCPLVKAGKVQFLEELEEMS
jgi:hypothetical protein